MKIDLDLTMSVRLARRPFAALLAAGLAACTTVYQPSPPPGGQPELGSRHFRAADGAVLPVRAWPAAGGSPKAVIVALHGFNDYSRAFSLPAEYLRSRGISVYAYDQRGFGNTANRGLWAGTGTYADDLTALAAELRRRYPSTPIYLLGESMGGAIAIAALVSGHPPPVDGLILSAPAVWSRDMMPWYQRAALAVLSATLPGLELTGSGLHIQASDNIAMLRELGRDPLVIKSTRVDAIAGLSDLMDMAQQHAGALHLPVLLLYGRKDQVIPPGPVESLARQLPPHLTRFVMYPEGYHLLLRDLHADAPDRDMADWIREQARSDPQSP